MRLILCVLSIFIGAVLLAIPNMTRRELLFAVPVPPDFRKTRAARNAISMFRTVVLLSVLSCVCALLVSPPKLLGVIAATGPMLIVLACALSFYWQYRRISPAAVQFTGLREAALTTAPEQLPRFVWLSIGSFCMLAAATIWLYLHWDRIPARYPVHFDVAGQPNRWAERTTRAVYGPILFAAEVCAWLSLIGLASWFGSRRSHFRPVILGAMIAVEYVIASIFCPIALQPTLRIPVWVIAILPMVLIVPLVALVVRKMSEPRDPMDPTPNECWKAGIFYYNPNDAALFVPKRLGLGYTLNFANHWSWALLISLALVTASSPLILG